MPFIEEKHLIELHESLEAKELSEEKLVDQLKEERYQLSMMKRSRNVLFTVSVILLIVIGGFFFTYMYYPELLINQSSLEAKNKIIIDADQLNGLEKEVASLRNDKTLLLTKFKRTEEQPEPELPPADQVIYAVQVAALENMDLSLFSGSFRNLIFYKYKNFNKYALGNFDSLEDARSFRKALVKLGFEDAFVASYKNGKRIRIEESL
ncbi:SPOR domain-containing protein [Robertkochia solimangrovi]|uniref:SPOR domain-containing protein n=1 Tax=Robertkochia solimangrovi TaxID=2213046 RepID=UPI00117C72F3|nr:SPOR domain-containing protein [Robertkochia solimangrovi]TRZ42602.1 SPOR domain-containing protein [Robertkochia solimangrovi]